MNTLNNDSLGRTVTDQDSISLAQRQHALVQSLVSGAPVPEGFDRHRVQIAARALLRKRADIAAHHLRLARAELGWRFVELFVEWAAGPGATAQRSSFDEAVAFASYLSDAGHWSASSSPPRTTSRRRFILRRSIFRSN